MNKPMKSVKTTKPSRRVVLALVPAVALCGALAAGGLGARAEDGVHRSQQEQGLVVQYLEIVTPEVDETCAVLGEAHGVEFSEPVPEYGNARQADLVGDGLIGVRGPMRPDEAPVVRPYVLVEDLAAAVRAAEDGGAEIAIDRMELPGHGTIAIYILGGIEHGLWEK